MNALKTIEHLTALAAEITGNKYDVVPFALGWLPYKNDVNMYSDVGSGFTKIVKWLIDEIENAQNKNA
jgi:hypothetical protein